MTANDYVQNRLGLWKICISVCEIICRTVYDNICYLTRHILSNNLTTICFMFNASSFYYDFVCSLIKCIRKPLSADIALEVHPSH